MNLPLLQPQKIDGVSGRISAMLNALVAQRNATADEVANLCGELAEAHEKIAALEKKIADMIGNPGVDDGRHHDNN